MIPQIIDDQLEDMILAVIKRLNYLQVRAHQIKPLKAKRRVVYGLREVGRKMEKLKLVIAARDLDPTVMDQKEWTRIISYGHENPDRIIVYGCTRRQLAKAITGNPNVAIGVVGVLLPDGVLDELNAVKERASQLRRLWVDNIVKSEHINVSYEAVYFGQLDICEELINRRKLSWYDPRTGDDLLHVAAARGFPRILSLLLSNGFKPEPNFYLQLPSHLAALHCHKECFELLKDVCDFQTNDASGQTTLDYADG